MGSSPIVGNDMAPKNLVEPPRRDPLFSYKEKTVCYHLLHSLRAISRRLSRAAIYGVGGLIFFSYRAHALDLPLHKERAPSTRTLLERVMNSGYCESPVPLNPKGDYGQPVQPLSHPISSEEFRVISMVVIILLVLNLRNKNKQGAITLPVPGSGGIGQGPVHSGRTRAYRFSL